MPVGHRPTSPGSQSTLSWKRPTGLMESSPCEARTHHLCQVRAENGPARPGHTELRRPSRRARSEPRALPVRGLRRECGLGFSASGSARCRTLLKSGPAPGSHPPRSPQPPGRAGPGGLSTGPRRRGEGGSGGPGTAGRDTRGRGSDFFQRGDTSPASGRDKAPAVPELRPWRAPAAVTLP